MKLHLTLEKDGVTKLETLDLLKLSSLGDYAKTIRHYIDKNWKLKDVKCKNKVLEKFLHNIIEEYEANPEKFRPPLLDIVKMGLKTAKMKEVKTAWKEDIDKFEKKAKKDKQKT